MLLYVAFNGLWRPFKTHLELCLKNGDVVDATIKGAKGRRSSARTVLPLEGCVERVRVIGREERTNSEQLQYRFLLLALTGASPSSTTLFINRIWFPGAENPQGTKYDKNKNIYLSCDQILEKLNHSQKEIVGAMLSPTPQDSLVIAHGMSYPFQPLTTHANTDLIPQGLLERGRRPQLRQQQRYGYPVNCRAG